MSSLPTPPRLGQRLPFPPSVPPDSAYSSPDVDTSLRIGDLLEGRYQIEAPLGEGGVGVVYRALQLKLHRRVAVKLLQHEVVGDEALRPRFQQEALTLAALSHPHIVTLQDYGVVRGRPFLVMELLEGRTLRQIIDSEAPLAPLRTLNLLRQVLLALAYAHEFGVVHRDLKPANLIVQALPAYEHVKVLDFGMVKLLPGSHLDRGEQLTRQGFTFGTPAYMSPEHAIGAEVDARSDLYSVGVLLFELLTGEKPFDGEVQDVLRHHLNTPVPQLAERRPELAELSELQALIDKAMAKEVADRFASARDMLEVFDALLRSGLLAEAEHELGEADVDDDLSRDSSTRLGTSALAPKLRETLETAAAALSSYARVSREVWRDKASPQLLRAQRELRVVAARLAPKLRGLSETAWIKLRPQLMRAAERVSRIALEAKARVETRMHNGLSERPRAPLALPQATQQVDLSWTEPVSGPSADATVIDLPAYAHAASETIAHAASDTLEQVASESGAQAASDTVEQAAPDPVESDGAARDREGEERVVRADQVRVLSAARELTDAVRDDRAETADGALTDGAVAAEGESVSVHEVRGAHETAEPLVLEPRGPSPS